jgi:hypothetical protein
MAPLVPLTGIAAAPMTPVAVDLDVLPWPSPGDSNPTQLLCGRRAELRFTVRRPPAGEVSPCCHRPSGGDVACSVHVGVAPASIAGLALEDRLALAVSGCDVPARGASLRRVRSRDLFNPAESLVLQPCDQLAPATSHDCAVEPALLGDSRARLLDGPARRPGHRPHVKSLDPDHLEPSRQVGGGLLDPVLAPIPLTGLQSRDRTFRLLAAIGTALAAAQPLLQHLQPLRLTRSQTRYMQQLAGRQRSRHGNAAVNADHAAIPRTADRVGDMRERDMPAASPITGNSIGLDTLGHRSRQAEACPSDLRHPHPTDVAIQPFDVMGFQPDLPKAFVHTGFAPCRAPVCPGEEVPHRLREIPQRLLLHRLTPGPKPRVLGARLSQLRRLLYIARSYAARLPVPLLLHRQIPYISRVPAVRPQGFLLVNSRQQPKPRHVRTVTATTDIPSRSSRAPLGIGFLPGLKSRVSSQRRLR